MKPTDVLWDVAESFWTNLKVTAEHLLDAFHCDRSFFAPTGLEHHDGWCDDPNSTSYNTLVRLPFSYRHEILWRDDSIYDVIVQLGYNDNPVIPGKGSAIFLHVAKPGYSPTEGCVALSIEDLLYILKTAEPETQLVVSLG